MKNKIIIILILLLLISIFITGCIEEKTKDVKKKIYVDKDFNPKTIGWKITHFNNIKEAISAVNENETIYVNQGKYYENLIINKTIILIGENSSTTIIDGNGIGDVIYISENGSINISGFKIKNSGSNISSGTDSGIDIRSNNNNISYNNISNNNIGIYSRESRYNNISNNIFQMNNNYGIFINTGSDFNIISNNIFINNNICLRIKGSKFNELKKNLIKNSYKGIYFCCGSRENNVNYNVFINNSFHGDDIGSNNWDNGIIGNYWDDYLGIDENNDGIGDTPYIVDSSAEDNYPIYNIELIN